MECKCPECGSTDILYMQDVTVYSEIKKISRSGTVELGERVEEVFGENPNLLCDYCGETFTTSDLK